MITKSFVVFLFLSFFFFGIAFSQENVVFERFSVEEGLSHGNVNIILQDFQGYIWVGTQDGLNRFDGYHFKMYKPIFGDKHSISNNIIKSLYEGKDSCMWIGTDGGGLNMYDPRDGKFYSYQHDPNDLSSLSNNSVYAVYEDKKGQIWAGTYGGGLCILDRGKGTFLRYKNDPNDKYSLSGNSIRDIFEDNEGTIWIGTDGGSLCKFDPIGKRFISYLHDPNDPESIGSNVVLGTEVDSKGYIWSGSWGGGVSRFDPKTGKAKVFKFDIKDPNSLSSNENFDILEDSQGTIWVCTRAGLDKLNPDGETFQHYRHDPLDSRTISLDVVIDLYEDNNGIMWVGTEGGGLCKVDLRKKDFRHYQNHYKDPNSLSSNDVSCIYEDSKGNVVVGTRTGGVNFTIIGTGIFKAILPDPNQSPTLVSKNIQSVVEDLRGNYWFGSNGAGVSRYNPQTNTYTNYHQDIGNPYMLENDAIFGLAVGPDGDVWISTYGGGIHRYSYETNQFKRYTIDPVNNMKNVGLSMYVDPQGEIWCGTGGHGLGRYNSKTDNFKFYEHNPADTTTVSANNVFSIYQAKNGCLWVGTGGGGINKFNRETETFTSYTTRDGLPNDVISGILEDDSQRIWIATIRGLSVFNPADTTFRNYDVKDGLATNAFSPNAVYKGENGVLYFGTINGFEFFHPDKIVDNKIPPKVTITKFVALDKEVRVGDETGLLSKEISMVDTIIMTHTITKFAFEFSALHYSAAVKNRYEYMMEGFDANWIKTDYSRRFASYTNLPGGTYVFKVRASNNDGVWNNDGVSVVVIMKPPYWKTWWFYSLIALFVLFVFYMLFRLREKQTLLEKQKMQKTIDDAVDEVEKQKKDILAQNAELQKRQEEDKKRQWFNEGIALFTDIIRDNKDNISKLSLSVLSNLVRYINAAQGGIYILNEENENDKYLELIGSYAYDAKKLEMKRIEIGETLVGSVFKEKKVRRIKNLPKGYLELNSALGKSQLPYLMFIPLKLEGELTIGVIELSSLEEFTDFKIEFLEKLSEIVTSQLFTTRITEKTQILLAQSQQQAEELRAQEEEARQSIEEIQANRDEANRLKSEAIQYINSMNHSTIRADFDLHGRLVYGNVKFLDSFGYKSKEANGLHVTLFFPEEYRAEFQYKWNALLDGSRHIEEHCDHITKDGNQIKLLSTFTVVKDVNGDAQKILYLGLDLDANKEHSGEEGWYVKNLDAIIARVELNAGGIILNSNLQFAKLMEVDEDDKATGVEELNIFEFFPENEKKRFKKMWNRVLKGEDQKGEFSRKMKDGEVKWVAINLIPNVISGEVFRVFFLATDITNKQLEILNTKQQLDDLEKTFKSQLRQAEEKIKMLEKQIP